MTRGFHSSKLLVEAAVGVNEAVVVDAHLLEDGPGGGGPVGSPTVTFVPATTWTTTTVTATASETLETLFLRVRVTRN